MHDDASPSSEEVDKPEKQQTRLERDPIGSLDDQDQLLCSSIVPNSYKLNMPANDEIDQSAKSLKLPPLRQALKKFQANNLGNQEKITQSGQQERAKHSQIDDFCLKNQGLYSPIRWHGKSFKRAG
jgi:hypothetical protein